MSKKHFFAGTFLLSTVGVISRIMGFFYRIFLSQTIGSRGIGLYQLVIPLQHMVLAVTTAGIQTALSRTVASQTALKRKKEAVDSFCVGTLFALGLSLAAMWIFYTFAGWFAGEILKEPETEALIRIISFCFPLASLHVCISSYYFGRKSACYPACTQLIEQTVRILSSYILVKIFLSRGIAVTARIAALGALTAEFAAVLSSLLFLSLHLHAENYSFFHINAPFRKLSEITVTAFPLTLNRLLLSLLAAIEVVLIPQRLRMYGFSQSNALSLYGIFTGMALPCILFPSTVTNSAAVMLTPSVAELQALGAHRRIRYIASRACTACFLTGAACMGLFYFFGPFAGELLFHEATAGTCIRTLSFVCPFFYTNIMLTSILNGLGKTGATLLHNAAGSLIRILFVLFAIPLIGIRGYLYGLLLSEILLSIMHIYSLYHIKS